MPCGYPDVPGPQCQHLGLLRLGASSGQPAAAIRSAFTRSYPPGPSAVPSTLRDSQVLATASARRHRLWPRPGSSAATRTRDLQQAAEALCRDDTLEAPALDCTQPPAARLYDPASECRLGGRCHLHPHPARLALPGGLAGSVLTQGRRLGDAPSQRWPAGQGLPRDGDPAAPAANRPDPSQ